MDFMWSYYNKLEIDIRFSAVDLRFGWFFRSGFVLAEDYSDLFFYILRELGDFKFVKSGKLRFFGDYRLNRD